MRHSMLRGFRDRWWAVAAVHPLIVAVLLTVFLSTRPVLDLAQSLSRLPPDERVGIYVLALALIVAAYATLLLELTLRQRREDGRGPRARRALTGVWEPILDQPGYAGLPQKIVVRSSDEGIQAELIGGAEPQQTVEPVEVTQLLTGEVFVIGVRTALEPPQLWQLELVIPANQEAYLVVRSGADSQVPGPPSATAMILRKSAQTGH